MCKIYNDINFKKHLFKRYSAIPFDISYGSIPCDALDSLVKPHYHRYKVRSFVD